MPMCAPTISPRRRWWSPMRCSARSREDITTEPLGTAPDGKPVYPEGHLADATRKSPNVIAGSLSREQFLERYGDVFKGPKQWQAIEVDGGNDTYRWSDGSTYVKNPPYFEGITMEPTPVGDIDGRPHPGGAGRFDHHRPHLPGRQHPKDHPGRRLPAASTRSLQKRLQQLRRAARQSRGHDARHLRQYPHQERDAGRRRRRRDQALSLRRRAADLRRRRCATRRTACRWSCSAARNTAPARRATGRPRARCCWA